MWQDIEQAISRSLGKTFKVRSQREISGGCINQALCLRGEELAVMVKFNTPQRLPMFEAEAAGLAAIKASESLRAPGPIAWGIADDKSWLALEFIEFSAPRPHTSRLMGTQLAALHRTTADRFGWDRDNTIGTTPQPNRWTADWISFFREQRIGHQLALARDNGIGASILARGEQLMDALPALFEAYCPMPSLLHGDLWGGNRAADEDGNPVIFDPAVYFGDRESDLAMTELFGGFDRDFYDAYQAAWPLDSGYRQRSQLYKLYHLLNHFNLFGAAYARQAESVIDALLAELGG